MTTAPHRLACVATALLVALAVGGWPAASAQVLNATNSAALQPVPTESILSNSVTNLHVEGDTLWAGPFLNLTVDGGATWLAADADSLFGSRNRLFSMDVEGSTVWAALGFIDVASDNVQSAGGFLVSTDGGDTFSFRQPQIDAPGDTVVQYGVSTLRALDVIVPQQSAPFDIDYDPVRDEVWVAGWASGIRKSTDEGRTWQRVVLPPDTLDAIFPDSLYEFAIEPRRGTLGWFNHMGFSVLVDEGGTVWAGTTAGVNRSTDGGLSWRRFAADGTPGSLTGSWVVSLEEQRLPSGNIIWMATWDTGEFGEGGRTGVTITRDGGTTFEQVLSGERFIDFAFDGEIAYVAGRESGLFISDDSGRTWRTVREFVPEDPNGRRVKPGADVLSVATGGGTIWVGTSDGLIKSTNGGATWTTYRVEVPLDPDTPSESVPRVDVFAYPNPFSPIADQFVRVRFDLSATSSVRLNVYDFGMRRIRSIPARSLGAGIQEITWDGTDDGGVRLANGTYVYEVDTGSETLWGTILLIE